MGLWHPVSLSPSCVTRGGERQVVGSLVGTVWPMGHQVKAWRSSCLLAHLGSWGDVVCVCVCVRAAQLRRSWGGTLALAACLLFTLPTACRGGSGALDGEQGIPTPCESGKASDFPETKLRLSTAPFSLPVSISHTGLSSPGTRSPTCVRRIPHGPWQLCPLGFVT